MSAAGGGGGEQNFGDLLHDGGWSPSHGSPRPFHFEGTASCCEELASLDRHGSAERESICLEHDHAAAGRRERICPEHHHAAAGSERICPEHRNAAAGREPNCPGHHNAATTAAAGEAPGHRGVASGDDCKGRSVLTPEKSVSGTSGGGGGSLLPQFKNRRSSNPSHLDSYQVYNLFNPARGIRDEMARKGITPRDHHKANVAAIALRSAKLHAIKEGQPPLPSLAENAAGDGTTEEFPGMGKSMDKDTMQRHISSNGLTSRQRISKVRQQSSAEGKQRERPARSAYSASVLSDSTHRSRSLRDKVDYMAKNISDLASAAEAGRKKRDSKTPASPTNENYGKVPPYLLRRKLELLHDKELKVQEERDRFLPPGLVLMKEEERLEVLKTLEENKEKLVVKLRHMPLVLETPSQIRGKGEVDAQLKEVEDSIKRFSRPKVYIRYTQ